MISSRSAPIEGIDHEQKTKTVHRRLHGQGTLAALKNGETITMLSARFQFHPTMINGWKRAHLGGTPGKFDKSNRFSKLTEAQVDELYRQIGQLKAENGFLSKKRSLKAASSECRWPRPHRGQSG
jgi:hypothetical protein